MMKNSFESVKGVRWTWSVAATGQSSASYALTQSHLRVLSNVGTRSGDYVTPTPHSYDSSRTFEWVGFSHSFYGTSRAYQRMTGYLGLGESSRWPSSISTTTNLTYNKAVSDVVEKIRGNLDLSVDLIQWRQVQQMLALYSRGKKGLVSIVSESFRQVNLFEKRAAQRRQLLKRGRRSRFTARDYERWYLRSARKLATELAKKRLEYVYGVKPLCSSIADLSKLISEPEQGAMVRVTGRGNTNQSHTPRFGDYHHHMRMRFFCRIVVDLKPTDRVLSNLSKISSLNPASLAWEAMPYSFVVDWFYDVGSWLRSVETAFTHGGSVVGGYVSRGWRGMDRAEWRSSTDTLYGRANAMYVRSVFSRTPLLSFPLPRLPAFTMDLGTSQVLNGFALLTVNASRVDQFIRAFAKR